MKKILLTACAVMMCIFANAQTIHWLTFIDTTDPNVGRIDVYGRQMLYGYFINEVNAALESQGYKSDIQDFYGTRVTPENCKDAVEMLSITDPDDIIVFYYIGHGVRPATDSDYMKEHPYPQMCMAQHNENKFIPLSWIDEQLSTKGARLSVTIGMCCNSVGSNVSIKDEPNFSPNYGATYLSSNKIKRIQELFLKTRGHIIATSSSPRQTSGCVQLAGPQPCHPMLAMQNPQWFRDWYSFAICCFFQTQLDKYNKTLNWDDFLGMISGFVDSNTRGAQTPIYDIYPARVTTTPEQPKPGQTKPSDVVKPKPVVVPKQSEIAKTGQRQEANQVVKQGDAGSREWINELTQHLSTLINVSLPLSERQALEKNLSEKLFAENAKVKFLAQDGAVIDKLDVSDWLGILATNPQGDILKVVVDEGTFDDNKKIKELKVREIFKK